MDNRSDDVAIVTGAAGGMGAAAARALARAGHPLILSDLHPERLAAVAEELRASVAVDVVVGDITDPRHVADVRAALGGRGVAALVHTAGISPSMGDGRRIFAVNFTATRMLVEMLLPAMAPGGAAVLIASMSGQFLARPMIDRAIRRLIAGRGSMLGTLLLRSPAGAYAFSKRAVQIYAQTMAPAFGRMSARIVSLSPGIIDTDMGRREDDAGPQMGQMMAVTPAGRSGHVDEIASVAAFLVSPAASYVTGIDLRVDGGTVAGVHAAGGVRKVVTG